MKNKMNFDIYPKVILKKGREKSDSRFHPWIFSGAIYKKANNIKPGDFVKVISAEDVFIGIGTYSPSSISVRIISRQDAIINKDFWIYRITKAKELRETLIINSNSYRLIHGEGDFLSGLIIDKYDNVFVLQAHDEGIYKNINVIKDALIEVFGNNITIYNKSKKTIPFLDEIEDGFLYGEEIENVLILENGLQFKVDFKSGQKTGFFLDQRDNRMLFKSYANQKDVLNLFCYTGGFSIYSLSGGANSCTSVDSSDLALSTVEDNINMNFKDINHTSVKSDVFKYMETNTNKYNLIVIDPPAFAKHQRARKQALHAYTRVNKMAIDALEKNGIIFTFSCSQAISDEDFQRAIFNAVLMTDRQCRVLFKLSQGADHPLDIYHPEGKYLKGLVLKLD